MPENVVAFRPAWPDESMTPLEAFNRLREFYPQEGAQFYARSAAAILLITVEQLDPPSDVDTTQSFKAHILLAKDWLESALECADELLDAKDRDIPREMLDDTYTKIIKDYQNG